MLTTMMIGDKIAEARKKINSSQAQLAGHLFISPQAVGKWERGESMPDIITLIRLAEILGVDLNYFSENLQPAGIEMASSYSLIKQSDEMSAGEQKKRISWDMSRGNWVDADFSGLNNLYEKFSSSNMRRCIFVGSDMSSLLLKNNNVDSCDFSGSDLSSCHIEGSNLVNNLFKECSLKESEFSGSYITSCDFYGADFTGVVFKSGGFQKNPINHAVWRRTTFTAMQILDTVFDGTVEECCFENCSFKKVTFQNSTLIHTFFKNKSLKGIRFKDCHADRMTYEFLKNGKADLSGITVLNGQ